MLTTKNLANGAKAHNVSLLHAELTAVCTNATRLIDCFSQQPDCGTEAVKILTGVVRVSVVDMEQLYRKESKDKALPPVCTSLTGSDATQPTLSATLALFLAALCLLWK